MVQDEAYLLVACRYVVRNPVRAGLVASPAEWPWSSYRATAALALAPPFLDPAAVWQQFDPEPGRAVARYRRFVENVTADAEPFPDSAVVGDETFVQRFDAPRARASAEVPRRVREERPALDRIFAGATTQAAREACAAEAFRSGHSMATVARFLQVHPSTVSKMVGRWRGGRA